MKEIMAKGGRWCNILVDVLDSQTYPYIHIFFQLFVNLPVCLIMYVKFNIKLTALLAGKTAYELVMCLILMRRLGQFEWGAQALIARERMNLDVALGDRDPDLLGNILIEEAQKSSKSGSCANHGLSPEQHVYDQESLDNRHAGNFQSSMAYMERVSVQQHREQIQDEFSRIH